MTLLREVLPRRSENAFAADAKPECLEAIRSRQCSLCNMILKEFSEVPYSIDFVKPRVMKAPIVVMFHPLVAFVRTDLVDVLRPWSEHLYFGDVSERGKVREDYKTMWFSRRGLIDMYSDEEPVPSPCRKCGRRCESGFETYCTEADLAGRDVVARCGGFGVLITQRVYETIPSELLKELKFLEYECRA